MPTPEPRPLTLHAIASIIDDLTLAQRTAMVSEVTRGNAPGAITAPSRATINALVNAGLAHTPYGGTALLTGDGEAVRRALLTLAGQAVPSPDPPASEAERLRAAYRRGAWEVLKTMARHPGRTPARIARDLTIPWPEGMS